MWYQMTNSHRLDCEAVSDECRFIIQSEDKEEAVTLAQKHMRERHEQDLTDEELENDHLQVV